MARIAGTGVDVVEVERVRRALERPESGTRFKQRVYTQGERAYCESRGQVKYQSYAARFAAKEAVMKALGTGWSRDAGWEEIEVVVKRGSAPELKLKGKAAQYARHLGITRLHLSLAHTRQQAIAYVIAER